MKKLLMTLAGLLAIGAAGTAVAADEKADAGKEEATTYVVEMTGVTWNGCKAYVREAFKKLDGVICSDPAKDIKITAGEKPGTQKVVFKSKSKDIDKKKAVAAIGDKKDQFVVQKVMKEGEKEES